MCQVIPVVLVLGAAFTAAQASTDVLRLLDRAGSSEGRSALTKDLGPFPVDGTRENQIKWFYERIRQETRAGDSNKIIELYKDLIKVTDAVGGAAAATARNQLAAELHNAGYLSEVIALREQNKAFFSNDVWLRISNLGNIARIKMGSFNDLAGGQRVLQEMEDELKKATATPREPEFVSISLAALEWTRATESRARGRFAEAVELFLGASDRYQRYADNLERLTKQYKFNAQKDQILFAREVLVLEAANTLRWMGRAVEAETQLKQLLTDQINRGARPLNISLTASTLGLALMNQGRWAEAKVIQSRAEEILRRSGLPEQSPRFAGIKSDSIPAYIGTQSWSDAYRIYQEAESIRASSNSNGGQRNTSPHLTLVLIKVNQLEQAHSHALRVVEHTTQRFGKDSYRVREAQGFLAMALKAQGKSEEAAALFQNAVSRLLDPKQRDLSGSGAAFLRLKIKFIVEDYLDLLATSQSMGQLSSEHAALVLWLTEAVRGSTVQQAINGAAIRFAASEPKLADLVREEQDLAISAEELQRKIGNIYTARVSQEEIDKAAQLMRQQMQANEVSRRAITDQIERAFPEYSSLVRPRAAVLSDVSSVLRADESYISIYVGFEKTYVTAVRNSGKAIVNVVNFGEKEVEQSVKRLRLSLDTGEVPLGKIPPFDFVVAHSLFDKLLKPLMPFVGDAPTWTVSTTGALGSLPLAVLVTAPYKANPDAKLLFAEYRSAPWLNRKVAIAYNPSASAMIALRKIPEGSPSRQPFFGVGDPLFGTANQSIEGVTRRVPPSSLNLRNLKIPRLYESNRVAAISGAEFALPTRSSSALALSSLDEVIRAADGGKERVQPGPVTSEDLQATLPDIPPLPDTRDEIRAIAISLGANPDQDAIYGAEATRDRLKATNLANRRVVAFATHGLIPGDLPGLTQPALTLAYESNPRDSLLLLEDILRLRLDADWVVLSACNTGAADGLATEAVSGLGRGFFYAGSRAVLLTHWPVESESAKKLVTQIFEIYSKKTSRALAVKRSADILMDSPGYVDPKSKRLLYSYAHPMFWAPYTLVGDSR
jgi:CHAT domain-containing protein